MLEEENAGLSQVVMDGIWVEGFCQEELEGVLEKFDDVLSDVCTWKHRLSGKKS